MTKDNSTQLPSINCIFCGAFQHAAICLFCVLSINHPELSETK